MSLIDLIELEKKEDEVKRKHDEAKKEIMGWFRSLFQIKLR